MLSGRPALFRSRASEAGEVIELDRQQLLALVQTDSELSELIMRAFILRRVELIVHGLGDVVLVGSNHCAGTLRVKEFLTRNGHPYSYIDLDRDTDVQDLLDRFQLSAADVPVLICRGEVVLSMSRYLIRRIEQNPAIVLRTNSEIVALEGSSHLERVRWRDDQAGSVETHDIRHVFVMTGAVPSTDWLRGCVALEQRIHQGGTGSVAGRFGSRALAGRQASSSSRNESARSVRRGRRAGRQYQACCGGSGRGIDRDLLCPSGAVRVGNTIECMEY